MLDGRYGSPNRPPDHDHCCSSLNDSISTLTFDDVSVSALSSAAPQIADPGGDVRPYALDRNEVGHPCVEPSWVVGGIGSAITSNLGGGGGISLKHFCPRMEIDDCMLDGFFGHEGLLGYNGANQQVNQIRAVDHDPMVLQHDWMHQQMMTMSSKLELAECSGENRAESSFEAGFNKGHLNGFMVPLAAGVSVGSSCDSEMVTDDKSRCTDEVIDKTKERRQKRMIKNRESAARSRARKQAYTNHLESEVARLREEIERLRKNKELDNTLESSKPRYQLRRTSSAQF